VKSNDRRSDLFNGQTSKEYSNIGRHLLFTKCRNTSLDADLPILLNNAFTDLKMECLALSKKHLNLHDITDVFKSQFKSQSLTVAFACHCLMQFSGVLAVC